MKYALVCFALFIHYISASPVEVDTSKTISCGTRTYVCVSINQFLACENRNGKNEPDANVLVSCPPDTFCQADGDGAPCLPTSPATKITRQDDRVFKRSADDVRDQPRCTHTTKLTSHRCNKYFTCKGYSESYLKHTLHTCPIGEGFDPITSTCIPASDTTCLPAVVEAMEVKKALGNPPKCPKSGHFPINTYDKCTRMYYRCGWLTATMELRTCPEGEIFNLDYHICRPDDGCQ